MHIEVPGLFRDNLKTISDCIASVYFKTLNATEERSWRIWKFHYRQYHFRHLLLYEFQNKNTTIVENNIYAVYRKDSISLCTCRKWFSHFRVRNFNIEVKKRFGQPSNKGEDKIRALVKETRNLSVENISNAFQN